MRNTIKIIILFAAIIFAIGGVFVYAATRIEPPKTPVEYNQYNVDLAKNYDIISNTEDEIETESMYTMLIDRINMYETEGKITLDEKDKNLSKFMNVYTPLFLSTSFKKFNKSNWTNNNHDKMQARVDDLKRKKLSNNNLVLSKSKVDSLNLVSNIINNYNNAKIVANSTSFTTVANARILKENASRYVNDKFLSNNTSLYKSLNSLMGKIGESHRGQLNYRINQLGNYRNVNQAHYLNTLVPNFDRVFSEYKENANSLYGGGFGTIAETNALFAKANQLMEKALVYYSLN